MIDLLTLGTDKRFFHTIHKTSIIPRDTIRIRINVRIWHIISRDAITLRSNFSPSSSILASKLFDSVVYSIY